MFKNAFKGSTSSSQGTDQDKRPSEQAKVATAAESINTASNPRPPITIEADRVHQYKKEASAQQAPWASFNLHRRPLAVLQNEGCVSVWPEWDMSIWR